MWSFCLMCIIVSYQRLFLLCYSLGHINLGNYPMYVFPFIWSLQKPINTWNFLSVMIAKHACPCNITWPKWSNFVVHTLICQLSMVSNLNIYFLCEIENEYKDYTSYLCKTTGYGLEVINTKNDISMLNLIGMTFNGKMNRGM